MNENDVHLPLGASGDIATDVPCRKCSYNLRGLSLQGSCPECGNAVSLSAHGDALQYASPEWIDSIANGAIFVSAASLFHVVPVLGLLLVFGFWKLGAPEVPATLEPGITVRKVIRSLAMGLGVWNCLMWVLGYPLFRFDPAGVFAVSTTAIACLMILGLVYLRRLAARIPDHNLSQTCRTFSWILGFCWTFHFALVSIVPTGPSFIMVMPDVSPCTNVCMVLVASITGAIIYGRVGVQLNSQARGMRVLRLRVQAPHETSVPPDCKP